MFFGKILGKHKSDASEYPLYRIILVGDANSHKADLLSSYTEGVALSSSIQVIATEPQTKVVPTPSGARVKLEMRVSGNDDCAEPVLPAFYEGADAVLMCYDFSQRSSYDNMMRNLHHIQARIDESILAIHIVGISFDIHDEQEVTRKEAHTFADDNNAKTSYCYLNSISSINKVFENVVLDIGRKKGIDYGKTPELPSKSPSPSPSPSTSPSPSLSLSPDAHHEAKKKKKKARRKSFFDKFRTSVEKPIIHDSTLTGKNTKYKYGSYSTQENSISYKVCVLGCEGVGKTSLVKRYMEGKYDGKCLESQREGEFVYRHVVELNDGVKVNLVMTNDTSELCKGLDKYVEHNCRNSHVVMLCYDITNRRTYECMSLCVRAIFESAREDVIVGLVGLKYDLKDSVEVSGDEGKRFAVSKGLFFRECSAKDNVGVNELLAKILYELHLRDSFDLPVSEKDANSVIPPSVLP